MAKKKSAPNGAVKRVQGLIRELRQARADAGDLPDRVRHEIEAAFRSDDLKTVGTSGGAAEPSRPKRKLGKKKS
jgi:hypothetical protein